MCTENAEPGRAAALDRLAAFLPNAGAHYGRKRGFDYGPGDRSNVSLLSPYLRHRVLLEEEVLAATLGEYSLSSSNKFVQEIFWRGYFKGWFEHRPDVWQDYRRSLRRLLRSLNSDQGLLERYHSAVEGRTGIDCFDAWAQELVSRGYLHNHARMWFASIWIFTLGLPWQLGADFFYRHLIDGDPASNTLSWRWVCGLHTKGKTYLARVSDITFYTENRFCPRGLLATRATPLTEPTDYAPGPLPIPQAMPSGERTGLLITEEDCSALSLLNDQRPAAVLGLTATRLRSPLPIGQLAYDFAAAAVADAVERTSGQVGVSGEMLPTEDWGDLLVEWASRHELDTIVTPYAPVGPVAERLASAGRALGRRGLRLLQLRRSYDSLTWPHAKRGYFKLRKEIPGILKRLGILERGAPPSESRAAQP